MATASAVTNWPGGSGVNRGEDFLDFLEVNFQMVHDDEKKAGIEGLRLWNEKSDEGVANVKHTSFTGFQTAPISRDSALIPWGYPIQGFDKTYTTVGYRLGCKYEDRLRRTGQYGLITKMQKALLTAMKDTIELNTADPFNKAFAATVPFICADGMNLVDTSRPLENNAGTWSNEETGAALSQNSLEIMKINFKSVVNGQGLLRPKILRRIYVPVELERKARELRESDKAPEDALNRKNVFKGEFDIYVQNYFTSSAAWFGATDKDDDGYQLYFYWGEKTNVNSWTMGDNPDVHAQRVKAEFVTGADVPRGLRGNAGP